MIRDSGQRAQAPMHSGQRATTPFMRVPVSRRVSGCTEIPAGLSNARSASSSNMQRGRTDLSGAGELSVASSILRTSIRSPPRSLSPLGAVRPFTLTNPASQASRAKALGTVGKRISKAASKRMPPSPTSNVTFSIILTRHISRNRYLPFPALIPCPRKI